jgi:glutamyl-tRNA reductase
VTGPVVTDADAYALLLEVVCGLRSPLAGETEVQSQFKVFLSSLDPIGDRDLLQLGQRVLADAKAIRSRHLQGVGVQAYGPLAAEFVPGGRHVVLLGTGALASELLETLSRRRHTIDQWGRRPQAGCSGYMEFANARSAGIRSTERVTLIVAAPVAATEVEGVAACYPGLEEIIDLRGTIDRDSIGVGCRRTTLDDLFRAARPSGPSSDWIAAAREEIRLLSQAFDRRDAMRPFGWDDLCA